MQKEIFDKKLAIGGYSNGNHFRRGGGDRGFTVRSGTRKTGSNIGKGNFLLFYLNADKYSGSPTGGSEMEKFLIKKQTFYVNGILRE